MSQLYTFLSGTTVALSVIAAAFFLHFFRRSKDWLFVLFAAAFFTMAIGWTALALLSPEHEARPYIYGVRLLGFLLIIAAVVYKNLREHPNG